MFFLYTQRVDIMSQTIDVDIQVVTLKIVQT